MWGERKTQKRRSQVRQMSRFHSCFPLWLFPHVERSNFEVLCNSKAISPLEFFHERCHRRCRMVRYELSWNPFERKGRGARDEMRTNERWSHFIIFESNFIEYRYDKSRSYAREVGLLGRHFGIAPRLLFSVQATGVEVQFLSAGGKTEISKAVCQD